MNPVVYLVGGAVRDELLGLPVRERDWVVTGASPEWLLDQGFRQVGADFPVFLHPETGEEYALARTERKRGHGYHGFTVTFDPGVSIEDDLARRDLTINAIARAGDGSLVDPHGGRSDLDARWLRHVSPAFSEDPLRVLRVARFAARLSHLGFRVHPDTRQLMRDMVASGELEHLVPERAWAEISRAMGGPRPRVFIETLRDCDALAVLLPELDRLFGVPQNPEYHPEVDTGEHVLMALDMAEALGGSADAVTAVLLHDLGKGLTPAEEWPSHRGHEHHGAPLVEAVCARFRLPNRTRDLAVRVCRHHLRSHRLLEARPDTVMKLLEALDAFRRDDVDDFVLACEADYRGRGGGLDQRPYPQGQRLRAALEAAKAIHARDLEGVPPGPEMGVALRRARVQAIADLAVQPGDDMPRGGPQQ
ncbi:multifunctional CCA addition/repair protein [Marinihelvus fidelis]|uniref:Multifunctional CCA protein n=1 Tax=Marinihelvus fidelis TaxID=2613842 RepID=A0A5N0TDD9_9GAMM|nr:multifunctional CCA addition/repair protein [Marinihelvus fidelis]KAA9131309.1 multifunctional CCA addition/repair protein [Marinihelvus fidelis]